MKYQAALFAVALCSACAAAKAKPLDIAMECTSDGDLKSATIEGKKVDLNGGDPFDRIKTAVGKDRPLVRLIADGDTPYRCIGGLIFTMQRLGFSKLEFITDPALKAAR